MGLFCSRNNSTLSEAFHCVQSKQFDASTSGSEIQASALRYARKLLEKNRGKRFGDAYESLKTVSYGATCTVELVRCKKTKATVAAKIMPKAMTLCNSRFKNAFRLRALHEIAAMSVVKTHRNAPRLLDALEDERNVYLIMDYYSGGELFEHIVNQGKRGFTEKRAAVIMKEIMEFLAYCHSLGLVHADLKPENIVLEDAAGRLKILDFGMSVFCRPNESMKNVFGTINYCSPEMANKCCGQKTDIWSAGVLLYFMLSGRPPFQYKNKEAVLCRLRRHPTVTFNQSVWDGVSEEAKNFIKRLLSPRVDGRPTAEEALRHVWLSDMSFSSLSTFELDDQTINQLKTYSQRSMMKRILWEHIARSVPEDQIVKQRSQFQSLDLDNNGTVDLDELKTAFGKVQPTIEDDELQTIFTALDLDQSGDINFTEFIAGTFMSLEPSLRRKIAKQSFMQFDKLGKGLVPTQEFFYSLLSEIPEDQRKQLQLDDLSFEITTMDIDGDGHISVDEFSSVLA